MWITSVLSSRRMLVLQKHRSSSRRSLRRSFECAFLTLGSLIRFAVRTNLRAMLLKCLGNCCCQCIQGLLVYPRECQELLCMISRWCEINSRFWAFDRRELSTFRLRDIGSGEMAFWLRWETGIVISFLEEISWRTGSRCTRRDAQGGCGWAEHLRFLACEWVHRINGRASQPKAKWKQHWKIQLLKMKKKKYMFLYLLRSLILHINGLLERKVRFPREIREHLKDFRSIMFNDWIREILNTRSKHIKIQPSR